MAVCTFVRNLCVSVGKRCAYVYAQMSVSLLPVYGIMIERRLVTVPSEKFS